ncbi:MAG TPA: hypothetical protein DCR55_07570 [Lentisphaeria bacterium]|nr:hypothetical protein [Lentisphaeria bacterium]
MLALAPITFGIWAAQSETRGQSLLRTIGAVEIAIAIQLGYLGRLHDPSLPQVQLSRKGKQQLVGIAVQKTGSTKGPDGLTRSEPDADGTNCDAAP